MGGASLKKAVYEQLARIGKAVEGIDGIQQVDAEPFGQLAHQRQDLIEVGFHLERAGAVIQGLHQFAVGDISVGEKDDGLKSRGTGVGGHGGGGVPGGNARHALDAQAKRLRDPAGHAVVFEGAGGIESLVLEGEAVEAGVGRGARGIQQGSASLAQRDHALEIGEEGDKFAIAPDAALIEGLVGLRRPRLA